MADKAILGLADAIKALRRELMEAVSDGWDEWMRFSLDPIELTVQAVVTKDVNGKIGWKILEFGAKYDSQTTQSITLKLTPQWRQADGTLTTNFTIASDTAAGAHFGPEE
jgi:Trypsin-co-occurring domain 2